MKSFSCRCSSPCSALLREAGSGCAGLYRWAVPRGWEKHSRGWEMQSLGWEMQSSCSRTATPGPGAHPVVTARDTKGDACPWACPPSVLQQTRQQERNWGGLIPWSAAVGGGVPSWSEQKFPALVSQKLIFVNVCLQQDWVEQIFSAPLHCR